MHPMSNGRHSVVIDDEEHVPTRRRYVTVGRHSYLHYAAGLRTDREIHEALVGIVRMGRDAVSDQTGRADIRRIGRRDLLDRPISRVRRGCRDRRTVAFEKVWRAKYLQTHLLMY